MIKFKIGWGWGNHHFNTRTYEVDIDHPILDISSSCSAVKPEIREWLMNTLGYCNTIWRDGGHSIYFKTEEDLAIFQLKWL